MNLLNRQVQQATTTRFNLTDYNHKELENMLLTCYQAEVIKRRMEMSQDSLLTTVFKDGKLVKEDTFMDIRERMYGGKHV